MKSNIKSSNADDKHSSVHLNAAIKCAVEYCLLQKQLAQNAN